MLIISNKNNTKIKFFTLKSNELSVGKLVGISYITGLTLSILFNISLSDNKTTSFSNNKDKDQKNNNEEIYEFNDKESTFTKPPERDIRDVQPTISVNYRVIKNRKEYNIKEDNNFNSNQIMEDDWDKTDNEW